MPSTSRSVSREGAGRVSPTDPGRNGELVLNQKTKPTLNQSALIPQSGGRLFCFVPNKIHCQMPLWWTISLFPGFSKSYPSVNRLRTHAQN